MKKYTVPALALVLVLALSAIAYAASSYTVGGAVSPKNSGSKSKPTNSAIDLEYKVTETEGANVRPAGLDAQKIFFEGIKINTVGPKCSASKMNSGANPSDASCPAAARLATGYARNLAGPVGSRTGPNVPCYLALRLYNAGGGDLALFVAGKPNSSNESKSCPLDVSRAIKVDTKNTSKGATISLKIPETLQEPRKGVRNALVELKLDGRKRSGRKNGKTVGVFESFACSGSDRNIVYTFDNESGPNVQETAKIPCTK